MLIKAAFCTLQNTFTCVILFNVHRNSVNRYYYPILEIIPKNVCDFPKELKFLYLILRQGLGMWSQVCCYLLFAIHLSILWVSLFCYVPNKPSSDSFACNWCWKAPAGSQHFPWVCNLRISLEIVQWYQMFSCVI